MTSFISEKTGETKHFSAESVDMMIQDAEGLEDLDDESIREWLSIDERGFHTEQWNNLRQELNGRPPKFKPEFCILLIYHLQEGHTIESFGGRVGVQERTVKLWSRTYPAFKIARDIGKMSKRMKWESTLQDSAQGKSKGNAACIIFALKNYFPNDYKDKREIENTGGTVIMVDTGIQRGPQIDHITGESRVINEVEVPLPLEEEEDEDLL